MRNSYQEQHLKGAVSIPQYLLIGNRHVVKHFKHYSLLLNPLLFETWNHKTDQELKNKIKLASRIPILTSVINVATFIHQYLFQKIYQSFVIYNQKIKEKQ